MAKNSSVVAVAGPTLHEKLDHRAELRQRLDEVTLEFMHAQETVRRKNSELIEAKAEIGGYLNAEGKLIDQRYQARLEDARTRVEKTQSALEAARKKSSVLKDEINSLERELAQSRGGIKSSEEVLSFQRDIGAARAEVTRTESLLAEQHRRRADAQARLQADERGAERADLAAKVALGEIDDKRLQEFDAETEKRQQAMDGVAAEVLPIIEAADSAIAGLERRLEAARRALSDLEAKRPAVLSMYFYSLVEVEGARYLELAHDLNDSYLKLMALDDLIDGNTLRSDFHQPMMEIPNFDLNAHQPLGSQAEKWMLYKPGRADFDKARGKLIDQMRALGIEIDLAGC